MANNYTLWIVSPPGLIWSHVFDEVALGLQSAFRTLGYTVAIVTDPQRIEGVPIVLGANLCPMYKVALPNNAIIYNLEQAHPGSRWFDRSYGYIELLKKHSVWDFSKSNIAALKVFGIDDVIHCAIGYAPELTRIKHVQQDTDIIFVGGGHPRRQKILEDAIASGMGLHQVYKVFGKERDDWLARGKIHLNIHKEPAQLLEIVRISYLLANKCFVISEISSDKDIMSSFKDGIVFCKYDDLVGQCLNDLAQPKKRKEIAEAGFEIFKKMPQSEYLAQALEEQGRNAPQKNVAKESFMQQTPRIFVAIASYRDPEIQPTIADLFTKASYPSRINVGVCLQIDPKQDKKCKVNADIRPGQIHLKQFHHSESKGANWARDQALQLMQAEDYVLIIDSHMRFTAGWDEAMLKMLKQCKAEKPVLSGYVPDYNPPNRLIHHDGFLLRMRLRRPGKADDPRLISISGELVELADERTKILYPTPFCVANFIFMTASTLQEVPIDPHIHFWGDEIDFAARLWTHGYDIFQPNAIILYHYWVRQEQFHLHGYREYKTPENSLSLERIRHLLELKTTNNSKALVDMERYGLGKERSLNDLWGFAGIDLQNRTITDDAEVGIWNLAAREKVVGTKPKDIPKQIERISSPQDNKRIFVQIAAYRDPDCQQTVKDLFEKSAHPERIFVGICWQFIKGEDDLCFQVPYPYPNQVRVQEVDARQSQGACWARNQVQKLWQGEEFTLQIDSHMRFEPGWDDMMLSMWKECGSEKAVLTCYPPGFTPPDTYDRQWIFGMSALKFDKDGIFLMIAKPAYEVGKNTPPHPMQGAFASANTLFAPSSIINDMPYDPHLYFFGEEIMLAVRLWTHGYDLFHPNRLVIFHDWNRDKRPTHFSDHKDWGKDNDRAFARVRHLLKMETATDPNVLQDIDKYGLGKVRTLEEYQAYSGVNFAHRTIAAGAFEGKFVSERAKPEQNRDVVVNLQHHSKPIQHGSTIKPDGGHMPKIFVNIASYRDPECQWTVKDLFEKAKYPDRINVGICWQFDPVEDKHCFEVSTRPDQVRILPVDWREAEGVCWARYQSQQLWDGEEYTLMIDSHMRFVPGWDELMIQELAACESPKPVLSCSPESYTPPNNLSTRMHPTVRRVKHFQPDGNIRCQGEMLDRSPPKPLKGAFLVANFIFSRSEITPEVPYDPYLYFDQEEITYAARLYTHGWDIFSARRQFLYHFYNDHKVPTGSVRPLHWRDLQKTDEKRIRFLRDRGLKRFNHMTGHAISTDPEVIQQLDLYGFGHERSFAQFEQYSGVDFKNKITTERALQCKFIENLHLYRDSPFHIPETEDKKRGMQPATGNHKPVATHSLMLQSKMLEPGDFFPLIELDDTNQKVRAVEMFAGKFTIACFLPANQPEFLSQFFQEFAQRLANANIRDVWQLFILDDTAPRLEELRRKLHIEPLLHADPNRAVAGSFGINPGMPVGFVLSPNLKIIDRQIASDPRRFASALVDRCAREMHNYEQKNRQQKTISEMAPALIVPHVLSPEFCAKCIRAFKSGHTFEGTVGALEKRAYRADVKVRTDYIVGGELLAELDEKLSRSFFPEIQKIFGFEVAHRELYKIGMYSGEKKGFFKQHRDNFDMPLGYRRIAATIHLNDDYEGGGLRFPEHDDNVYRPVAGSGIAFSCSTLHEARPVTQGERYVIVGFFHGKEDEAYRHYFSKSKNQPLKIEEFKPTLRLYPEVRQSRGFFEKWQNENVRYAANGDNHAIAAPHENSHVLKPQATSLGVQVNMLGNHRAKKVFESKQAIIFDDFLPEDIYTTINNFALTTDYERINTHGKSVRAWHVHDGFPLRTCKNVFYNAPGHNTHTGDGVYPTKTAFDPFIEHILAVSPQVEHLVGKKSETWGHFSVTGWMYPHGTGLAMHDDGSGVYTGAYVYFINPVWRPHWGGLLLLADEEANRKVHEYRSKIDQIDYYQRKWLHANSLDEMLMEHGFAQCIFPKRNRIVFIANDAYHMVTRVNEQSGDNLRMSLAGFFNRKK